MNRVSIIIPVVNEELCLRHTLRQVCQLDPPAHEILVVDGGSTDASVSIAREVGVPVIACDTKRRSVQMNLGASRATGDILCFLHADTTVPLDAVQVITHTLSDSRIACGGFISLMRGPASTRWVMSLHNYLKTYYAPLLFRPYAFFFKGIRLLFGDQVMFCRRRDFLDCGGFNAQLPIMEEADLCIKLNRAGRIRQINRIVESSDRRVAKWGFFKATAIYMYVGFMWGIGYSPEKLQRLYEDIR